MRARTPLLAFALVAVAIAATVAIVGWSRWGAPVAPAGPLDALLPEGADAALRFSPAQLLAAPAAERVWEHPSIVAIRAESGFDERVLAPLRDMEAQISSATLGLAPGVGVDLLGDDTIVALYGEDVLVLARLSMGGRVVDLVQALGRDQLIEAGLRMEGETAVLANDGAPTVYLTRFRDVLALATRRGLAEAVVVRGERVDEFRPEPGLMADTAEPGARLLLRGDPALLIPWLDASVAALDTDAAPHAAVRVLRDLATPAGALISSLELDFSDPDRMSADLRVNYGEARPALLDALPGGNASATAPLRQAAAMFAVPGETMVTGALSVRAADVVRTLADAQPPSRRALLAEMLAERSLTLDLVADTIAAHLRDGLGFVVARLDETDGLELDDPTQGGVHPIPATLAIFELKDVRNPEAALAAVIAESETLFGARIEFSGRELPGDAELFRLSQHRFGGEWALLQPAVAVVDRWLLFSTHEEFLVRAIEQAATSSFFPGQANVDGSGPSRTRRAVSTFHLTLAGESLRRYIDDQRWAWADQASFHNWRAERGVIRKELDAQGLVLRPEDRHVYEDTRIETRLARRNAEEFPAAIAAYRDLWAPLEALEGIEIEAAVETAGLHLRVDVRLRD